INSYRKEFTMSSRRTSLGGFVLLVSGTVAFRETAGQLIGQVNDASQASVPGAVVTAQNTATGQRRSATTDSKGSYSIPDLPIGTYNLTAEHAGFSTSQRPNVQI